MDPAQHRSPDHDESAQRPPSGRIVVGVDGSPGSRAALRWALREAGWRGAAVQAVTSRTGRPRAHAGDGADDRSPGADAQAVLDQLTETAMGESESGDVTVNTAVIDGHPVQVLLEAARGADLLVVGSRGHGALLGTLIGSVSHALVVNAPCAVVVIPDAGQLKEREAALTQRRGFGQGDDEAQVRSQAQMWRAVQDGV